MRNWFFFFLLFFFTIQKGNVYSEAIEPSSMSDDATAFSTMNESKVINKSFRQHNMTREALPRLDNYRNILSVHVGHRPTLDELHENTIHEKVRYFYLISYEF